MRKSERLFVCKPNDLNKSHPLPLHHCNFSFKFRYCLIHGRACGLGSGWAASVERKYAEASKTDLSSKQKRHDIVREKMCVVHRIYLFKMIQNLKLTKPLICSQLLKVQVQDVRFARWCVRRQLCLPVK